MNSHYSSNYHDDKCIHELIERQAERTPGATAVICDNRQLTHGELNTRANRLAHYLMRRGAGPGTFVGVCVERSVEAIVALLGVFKTGGIYVPLDPAYPRERLAYMLENSSAKLLVTQERFLETFLEYDGTPVCLDTETEAIGNEDNGNPRPGTRTEDIAYAIYTSGSTGSPKGVLISQKAITGHCIQIACHYELNPEDRVYQSTSLSFDGSMEQILPSLLVGAAVILRGKNVWPPHELQEKIAHYGLTVLCFPPAYLHEWAQYCIELRHSALLHQPRLIICGGDELLPGTVQLLEQTPIRPARLLNVYGPTEATITTTTHEVKPLSQNSHLSGRIPIGRPLPDRSVYILDGDGSLLPPGAPGEIHIGGEFLACGYLGRPDLTEEKFIADPFGKRPGARLYKTGDLGRYLPDGAIEFLGRIDHQVKIRGFRIELGEIEAMLGQHPALTEMVVMAREDYPGDRRLVAYVVPHPEATPTTSELRRFLGEKLPEYMIPSVFVHLDSLPLTANGKVDRRALPVPNHARPLLEEMYVPPRNAVEQKLAAIWAEVLGLEQVGVHDNFFELGGDSLSATRVIARLQDASAVELSTISLFDAPTIEELAHCIAEAPVHSSIFKLPPVLAHSYSGIAPLSFGQQEIWLSAQLWPDVPVYNETLTVHMKGTVNPIAVEQAVNCLIVRHEILRTAFIVKDGRPVQSISKEAKLKLMVDDLRSFHVSEREGEALRRATVMARRPFSLDEPPLIRAMLIQLDGAECRLYLVLHHLVMDGVSINGVLIPELWVIYESLQNESTPLISELSVQYCDYAMWQRECLQGPVLEERLAYWRKQLDGAQPLELSTDRPRPMVQSFHGAFHSTVLSKELTYRLKALGRREGCTLYMVLLSAFKTLLRRYTHQDDITVGTVEGGRIRPELEPLLGYFLNMLVIRTRLSGDPEFREFLHHVRQMALEAYDHKDLPFITLVEALKPPRDPARHPLFQVAFIMEPTYPVQESGWTVSQLEVHTGTAKFDLTIDLDERGDLIIGRFEYNTDMFDAATMRRMAGHYQMILEGIVANPHQRLSELPLLTDSERLQLLVGWNNTVANCPKDKCIHELFEEQVDKTPDVVAVIFEERQLTYRELNCRANQLAHYLRKNGVGPESLVAICVERSLEMVVGILGILKAGGAYVPLDPIYPEERLAFILEDTRASILITQAALRARLPVKNIRAVCIDDNWEVISRESPENPAGGTGPDNLAYVIYTSGSTGRPKGVLVTHYNVVRLFESTHQWFHFNDEDVWTLFHSYAFDFSVWELWGALIYGGRLIVVPFWVSRSLSSFLDLLIRQNVTVLNITPSAFRQLIQEERDASFSEGGLALRLVIFGGESLQMNILKPWFERHGDRHPQLVNMYGITETTVHVTYQPLMASDAREAVGSVIGRPIPDLKVHILDPYLQPVPIGISGEIYVGGDGLARGYLNRPQLTLERFIPDPFSEKKGSCLYKTGDLARYLPDGTIEFLGRIDHQVKIRGFRIEPGEIEAVLGQHPPVREAIVVAREDQPGDKRLVAYVTVHQSSEIPVKELRNILKEKLPDYMIPSAFVVLDTFPLTPNGKVNQKALPAPESGRPDLEDSFAAPRTPVEELLAGIWCEVLGMGQVGIHDNFFELGGHSLLATRVVSHLRLAFNMDLPLRYFFESPTVAGLAETILQAADERQNLEERAALLLQISRLSEDEVNTMLDEQMRN